MKKYTFYTLILVVCAIALLFIYRNTLEAPIVDIKVDQKADSLDKGDGLGGNDSTPKIEQTYKDSNIEVDLPYIGAVVGKDFSVIGRARGTWFFEGSFPVKVIAQDGAQKGKVLSTGIAQVKPGENWMTEDFVSFKADIKVPQSYIGKANIVLQKDNPSGLPEHDASVTIPVTIEY